MAPRGHHLAFSVILDMIGPHAGILIPQVHMAVCVEDLPHSALLIGLQRGLAAGRKPRGRLFDFCLGQSDRQRNKAKEAKRGTKSSAAGALPEKNVQHFLEKAQKKKAEPNMRSAHSQCGVLELPRSARNELSNT